MTDPRPVPRIPEKVRKRMEHLNCRTAAPISVEEVRHLITTGKVVNAPLDGYSDPAWRTICLRKGAALCYTEMIPAIALVYGAKDAMRRLTRATDEEVLAVQIEGANPEIMVEAAKIAANAGADIIDINAGCPSSKVTNSGAGAGLLLNLPLLEHIIDSVKKAVNVAVTLKIRSGPSANQIVVKEIAAMVNDLDVAAVTLHPRTKTQGYRGKAEWTHIRTLKERCRPPVIGNGDIRSAGDAMAMFQATGCDAVMVARGGIGNPWLFRHIRDSLDGRPDQFHVDRAEWEKTVWEHFQLMVADFNNDEELAARLFRKHLTRYTRGMNGSAAFRGAMATIVGRASLEHAVNCLLDHEEEAGGFVFPMPRPDDTFVEVSGMGIEGKGRSTPGGPTL